jgi:opacity protein-like surface antigen
MKKILFSTFLFSFVFIFSVKAENIYRPYIGADFSYNKAKTNFIRPDYEGALLNIGTTYNTYFGTELFYHQVASRAKTLEAEKKYKTSYRAYGLDAILTLPLFSKLDANASIGIASYVFTEKFSNAHHLSDEGIGYRFAIGTVYHLTDALAARLNARYIGFDHISNLKHTSEYTLGLRYYLKED